MRKEIEERIQKAKPKVKASSQRMLEKTKRMNRVIDEVESSEDSK